MMEYFKEQKTFLGLRKASPRHWYTIAVGRSNFHLSLTLNSRLKRVGVELYMRAPESKLAFPQLISEKEIIEKELGASLEWQELPHKGASRIIQYHDGDFEDKSTWNELFEWFYERSEAFHKAFSQRVVNLDLDEESEAA